MNRRDDIAPERRGGRQTEDAQLLEELVGGLEPVRPLASLRLRLLAVLAAGLCVFFAAVGFGGTRGDLSEALVARPEFLATFLGLAGLVLGGALAALAASTPGREEVGEKSGRLALGSFGLAVVVCAVMAALAGFTRESSVSVDLMCLRQSLIFGALPVLVAAGLVFRGWVERPGRAALAALASGAAFGALIVHLACNGNGAVHLLSGHLSVPLIATLVLGLPLARGFERWGR